MATARLAGRLSFMVSFFMVSFTYTTDLNLLRTQERTIWVTSYNLVLNFVIIESAEWLAKNDLRHMVEKYQLNIQQDI